MKIQAELSKILRSSHQRTADIAAESEHKGGGGGGGAGGQGKQAEKSMEGGGDGAAGDSVKSKVRVGAGFGVWGFGLRV